jgi:sulfide:quinone oxidoreductase
MTEPTSAEPVHVVIVGGGIAALETVLALHDLAGDRVRVTLVAPEPDFTMRPLRVAAPFARGYADPLPLADVMREHGGEFVRSAVLQVDAAARTVTLAREEVLAYDVLVLAQGASSVPAFAHGLTFGSDPLALNGILADLEEGWSRSAAFVVPAGASWPLPLYELALMTAEAVWAMNMDRVDLHLVTTEQAPLEIFGAEASAAVAQLLSAARITVHHGVAAQVPENGRVDLGSGVPDLVVDRVVALPLLEGRRLDGVPCDDHGFVAVDDAGLIAGLDGVYAVGDATDRPIKQGGLACQQADVTAAQIAVRAGADIVVPALEQVLRGRLLTGAADRFLRRDPVAGDDSAVATEPLWWPPVKVSSRYLTPYLIAKNIVHLPVHEDDPGPGVDVDVPLPQKRQPPRRPYAFGVSSLGEIARR